MADNTRAYLHEYVTIKDHNRAKYMYHMTANFSPMAQEDRKQLCYGVWGVLGSTGRWPEVVNIWEFESFEALATYFRIEVGGTGMQDPRMAKWWSAAVPMRAGGVDRLMIPAPWTRTVAQLCADKVTGELYAHDHVAVRPGSSSDFLELIRERTLDVYARYGWTLVGAWYSIMTDDAECFLLWAVDSWENWVALEKAQRTDDQLVELNRAARQIRTNHDRIVLVDSPFNPTKIHRQVARSDRTEPWDETVDESAPVPGTVQA